MCTHNSNSHSDQKNPIVLLHGWGMNRAIWQPCVANLPETTASRIVTLDLPGYGDNVDYAGEYGLNDLANWLADTLTQRLGEEYKVTVIGWSLGGLVAQQFALSHPDKIAKLGLIGSTPKFLADTDWAGIKPDVLDMFAAQLIKNHQATIDRFLAIQAMGAQTAKQDIKHLKDLVTSAPTPNIDALIKGLTLLAEEDLRSQWSQLTCPIFALFGKLDSLVPVKVVEKITSLSDKISTTIHDKASHAPFISHPEQFTHWLLKEVN